MYKKVLVIDLNFMGDMMQSSPVMRCLKNNGVEKLDVMAYEFCAPVLLANPYIDNVIPIRKHAWGHALMMRFRKYDLILQLNTSLKTNILMWLMGGKDRLGYDYKHRGFLNTIRVPLKHRAHKGTIYRPRQNLELLERGLGWTCKNIDMIFSHRDDMVDALAYTLHVRLNDSNSTKPRS
jgi:ADP-heptose:LPS heptosyltransferase